MIEISHSFVVLYETDLFRVQNENKTIYNQFKKPLLTMIGLLTVLWISPRHDFCLVQERWHY